VNIENTHWTLVVIYVQEKRIQYYDSYGSPGTNYLNAVLRYVGDTARKLRNTDFRKSEWVTIPGNISIKETPRQYNGYDCGVFVIMYVDFLTDRLPLHFSEDDMPLFRKKICANVLRGNLKYSLKFHV
jgi:Ulp1 family protease